jgi:hypothetical protein
VLSRRAAVYRAGRSDFTAANPERPEVKIARWKVPPAWTGVMLLHA